METGERPARRNAISIACVVTVCAASYLPSRFVVAGQVEKHDRLPAVSRRSLELRIGVETLHNPYWYAANNRAAEAQRFWDRQAWDRVPRGWAAERYNAVLYWVEPWNKHGWQTFLIRHRKFSEARDFTAEQYNRAIEQASWIFHRAA